MRTLSIFISFLFATLSIAGQEIYENELKCLNNFLGEEKAAALDAAVESFDQFIIKNYPEYNSQAAKTEAFLKQITKLNGLDPSWNLNDKKNKKIIEAFEKSGLRKEIWVYGYEENEYIPREDIYEVLYPGLRDSLNQWDTISIEEDIEYIVKDSTEIAKIKEEVESKYMNSLHFNFFGSFLYGLLKCSRVDTLIKDYAIGKETWRGKAHPIIVAGSFLELEIDVEDPFNKRILVVEIYYDIMKMDIQQKE